MRNDIRSTTKSPFSPMQLFNLRLGVLRSSLSVSGTDASLLIATENQLVRFPIFLMFAVLLHLLCYLCSDRCYWTPWTLMDVLLFQFLVLVNIVAKLIGMSLFHLCGRF